MSEIERSRKILKILNKIYPKTSIPLKHTNKFTLLISVLLSAQTTDVNVNNVTKEIYPKFNKPEYFVKLEAEGSDEGSNTFILGPTLMDAHEDGDSGVNVSPTLANIDVISLQSDTATCKAEIFVAIT